MNLTQEQNDKRIMNNLRIRGRTAVIYNPYYSQLAHETKVYISAYIAEKDVFRVETQDGKLDLCLRDELNLIDKEFSDFKIIKKGIRTERKDKYGDRFIVELINNKRDIYLSSALVSLLNLNNKDKSYVGFATDPDTKMIYIFSADEATGYEFNKSNNRITSAADWRELNKLTGCLAFDVRPQSIIDNINNPDTIFYSLTGSYDLTQELVYEQSIKKEKPIKKEKGNGVSNGIIKSEEYTPVRVNWGDMPTLSYKSYSAFIDATDNIVKPSESKKASNDVLDMLADNMDILSDDEPEHGYS